MPTIARRTIAVAAAAVAIIAATVALDLPSAQAEPPLSQSQICGLAASDSEQDGRIVARRSADGRTEFGWQYADDCDRVLPDARYFPADAQVGRWLRSSPVELAGRAIGRISARQLADGRIEFAFTPTNGERILPPSRYFPADARVGRWLRSSEIAISLPIPFSAVNVGEGHSCAIRNVRTYISHYESECWGSNEHGQLDAPDTPPGSTRSYAIGVVSAGSSHTCGLSNNDGGITPSEIKCWGDNEYGQSTPPAGREFFSTVSAGRYHTCGITEEWWWGDGTHQIRETLCWGNNENGQTDAPAGSDFTAVSAGGFHTCAIHATSAQIECWGLNNHGQTDAPAGRFSEVSAGGFHNCGLSESGESRWSGEIACWGSNSYGQLDAPAGRDFTAVSAGRYHTCAIRESGEIECWGNNKHGQSDAPAGRFIAVELVFDQSAVSAGADHTCAIRESGEIACWGGNHYGQTDAPAPRPR